MSVHFHLDVSSLNNIFSHGTTQTMVYGYTECDYHSLSDDLEFLAQDSSFPIQKVFDYRVGINPPKKVSKMTTLEGRKMCQISYDKVDLTIKTDDSIRRQTALNCKAGLNTIVMENYKRKKENLPLIPILFILDSDDNRYPFVPHSLCSRTAEINNLITHKELRRMYKLCFHSHPDFEKIAQVARESLIFAKLTKTGRLKGEEYYKFENNVLVLCEMSTSVEHRLEKLSIDWSTPEWKIAWSKRVQTKTSQLKSNDWREQMIGILKTREDPAVNF